MLYGDSYFKYGSFLTDGIYRAQDFYPTSRTVFARDTGYMKEDFIPLYDLPFAHKIEEETPIIASQPTVSFEELYDAK